MKTVILTIALILVSVLLLGVRVLFVKGGKFPTGHADTEALRAKGVGCAYGHNHSPADNSQSESH